MAPETPPTIDPDEPVLLLRGADPAAWLAVLTWGCVHEKLGTFPPEQTLGAFWLANSMERYARAHGQDVDRMLAVWVHILNDAASRLQVALEPRPPGHTLQ
jgi:hypothetical protein